MGEIQWAEFTGCMELNGQNSCSGWNLTGRFQQVEFNRLNSVGGKFRQAQFHK